MRKIGSIFLDVIVSVWFLIALFVTICLLSYNDFKVTTFGKYSLIIMDSDELEPDFNEGDLLIVKKSSDKKLNVADRVFYYNTSMDSNVLIYTGTISEKVSNSKAETTYTIDSNEVSSSYVIGKFDAAKSYPKLGLILHLLSSKWGYMFLVIFPTLFAIMYEVMMIFDSLRKKTL